MNSSLIRRFTAATVLAASLGAAGFAAPAFAEGAEATAPGSCDFGAPKPSGFACFDSDDIGIILPSAHTDNGILKDHIDVDWSTNGNNRAVVMNGWGRIKPTHVGKVTLQLQCFKSGASSPYHTITKTAEATSSFHAGKNTSSLNNAGCPISPQLSSVKVTLKFVTGAGSVQQQTKTASFGGA